MNEQTKTCTKCGETKPLGEFYRQKRGLFGCKAECKVCSRKRSSEYRDANPDRVIEHNRTYRAENPPDKVKAKEYRDSNKETRAASIKLWRAENIDHVRAYAKAYCAANEDAERDRRRKWAAANPSRRKEINEKHRTTVKGRLEANMRARLNVTIVSGSKDGRRTFDLLGFTSGDLRIHLESLFAEGMTWDNYGYDGWHVDHVRPLASFSYETPDDTDFKEAWALSNLQPLWASDNFSKNSKWTPPTPANDNVADASQPVSERV